MFHFASGLKGETDSEGYRAQQRIAVAVAHRGGGPRVEVGVAVAYDLGVEHAGLKPKIFAKKFYIKLFEENSIGLTELIPP